MWRQASGPLCPPSLRSSSRRLTLSTGHRWRQRMLLMSQRLATGQIPRWSDHHILHRTSGNSYCCRNSTVVGACGWNCCQSHVHIHQAEAGADWGRQEFHRQSAGFRVFWAGWRIAVELCLHTWLVDSCTQVYLPAGEARAHKKNVLRGRRCASPVA
jgi:hypothetical protein